jgi:hypothetical protein
VLSVIPVNSFDTVGNLNVSVDNVGEPTIGVDFGRTTGLGDGKIDQTSQGSQGSG